MNTEHEFADTNRHLVEVAGFVGLVLGCGAGQVPGSEPGSDVWVWFGDLPMRSETPCGKSTSHGWRFQQGFRDLEAHVTRGRKAARVRITDAGRGALERARR